MGGGGVKELTQVRSAVTAALQGAGLTALTAFPAERARAYEGAVAAVAVGTAHGPSLGRDRRASCRERVYHDV